MNENEVGNFLLKKTNLQCLLNAINAKINYIKKIKKEKELDDEIEAINKDLIQLTHQKEDITTELEKIDNELTLLTKDEISK